MTKRCREIYNSSDEENDRYADVRFDLQEFSEPVKFLVKIEWNVGCDQCAEFSHFPKLRICDNTYLRNYLTVLKEKGEIKINFEEKLFIEEEAHRKLQKLFKELNKLM